jgi:hypothetical protein
MRDSMNDAWKHRLRGFLVFLLASPLGNAASFAVSRIPGLWRGFFLNPVLPRLEPAGVAELKRWASLYPDTARIQFSLGLRYSEAGADNKALACLRSSQWLGFESIERISGYRASIAARFAGEPDGGPASRPEPSIPGQLRRILAVGDRNATSARWFPGSGYLLICPEVNGLTPSCIGEKGIGEERFSEERVEFDVAFGSNEAKHLAAESGIRYVRWHTIDWHTTDFEA